MKWAFPLGGVRCFEFQIEKWSDALSEGWLSCRIFRGGKGGKSVVLKISIVLVLLLFSEKKFEGGWGNSIVQFD